MKCSVTNQASVKRADSNLFVAKILLDELSMLVLSSAEKPGSP